MCSKCCATRFLPDYCRDFRKVVFIESGGKQCLVEAPDKKEFDRRLDLSAWQLSWDNYTPAVAMLGQVCDVRSITRIAFCSFTFRWNIAQRFYTSTL